VEKNIETMNSWLIIHRSLFIVTQVGSAGLPPLPGLKVAALPRAAAKLRWHHEKVSLVRATSGDYLFETRD
jgi:hypothetical protein